ncbi:hypothetical protein ABZ436_28985 [Micromonospora matsumotoense]|uniref:hypothetical protein n=1 Tax=Micromonospora matsumotoense TaxID=121616 RepID=UPI0034064C84
MADDPSTPVDLMRALTRAERLLARRVGAVLATEGLTVEAWRVPVAPTAADRITRLG